MIRTSSLLLLLSISTNAFGSDAIRVTRGTQTEISESSQLAQLRETFEKQKQRIRDLTTQIHKADRMIAYFKSSDQTFEQIREAKRACNEEERRKREDMERLDAMHANMTWEQLQQKWVDNNWRINQHLTRFQ